MHYAVLLVALLLAATGRGETQVGTARLLEFRPEVVKLNMNGQTVTAKPTKALRLWKDKKVATGDAFRAGDTVVVRLSVKPTGTELREMADPVTAEWLSRLRKGPVEATALGLKDGRLAVRFADGSGFSYRVTSTTKLDPGREPSAITGKVYIRARLLSNLDTLATLVSARPIADEVVAKSATKATAGQGFTPVPIPKSTPRRTSAAKEPLPPMASSGKIKGTLAYVYHQPPALDVKLNGQLVRFWITPQTRFFIDGERVDFRSVEPGIEAIVSFRKDTQNRLLVTRMEMP
jgi:hypothetical protein